MQRYIKKVRKHQIIDMTDFDIVELYDKFFSDLAPLYKELDPLDLTESHPVNVLIDEIILDRIIAYAYRKKESNDCRKQN